MCSTHGLATLEHRIVAITFVKIVLSNDSEEFSSECDPIMPRLRVSWFRIMFAFVYLFDIFAGVTGPQGEGKTQNESKLYETQSHEYVYMSYCVCILLMYSSYDVTLINVSYVVAFNNESNNGALHNNLGRSTGPRGATI